MVTRISSLNSGMDIDGLIAKMMTAERAPVDKLNQQKQSLTWKTQAYRDINTKIAAFRDSLSTLRFGSSTAWNPNTVSSANTSLVEASAGGNASAATHNIVVTRLASGGTLSSGAPVSNSSLTSDTIAPVSIANSSNNNKVNITINGVTRTVTIADGTYNNSSDLGAALQTAINSTFGANQIKVDTTTASGKIMLTTGSIPGSTAQITVNTSAGNTGISALGYTDGSNNRIDPKAVLNTQVGKIQAGSIFTVDPSNTQGSFTVNGQTITFDTSTDSLNSIITKVNSSNAGVTMSHDSVSDRIVLNTKDTGSSATISIADGANSNFVKNLRLDVTAAAPDKAQYSPGQNAQVSIDGVAAEFTSNSFTNNGINYTLKNVTGAAGVTVSSSPDKDALYNNITDFVNKYNDLLSAINTLINEPKYRDFKPLTSDQKSQMKDSDIKNWEEKAKSGLLGGDAMLTKFRDSLRQIVYSTVETLPSANNALYKIGITTQTYVQGDAINAGKLKVDSSALKAAIAQNPQGVIDLFTHTSATGKAGEKGIMQQIYNTANTTVSSVIKSAGGASNSFDNASFLLGKQISDLTTKIASWQDKLNAKEKYYYKNFAKMDSAIGKSNSQISWLQSQMR
ncbi:flagellar hook-associated protein 2 [Paenibacillus tianmuensis]|uniref:Flagellar hook-associated protein 2 n=1 Tax=Paenibacillus tianmuensis TaxID=624147 RepID=A0A1G4RNU0_9BACL|nr:flagellar filament capping protein FliD [Paenibacillus tianmuensis]SCW58612.1 flagellar hook-associated protein 2 [Paenibacillus tianmuensis]